MTTYLIMSYIVGLLITREVCLMIRTITDHNDKEDKRITFFLSILSFVGLITLIVVHYHYKYSNKNNNRILSILLIASLFIITSCKKDNKQPVEPTPEPTPVYEPWWHLSGNWQCIGTDTMFTTNLKISYCCTANNGSTAVYSLSYPIWGYGKVLNVSYHYNADTIGFSNGLPQPNYKEVYFKRIK